MSTGQNGFQLDENCKYISEEKRSKYPFDLFLGAERSSSVYTEKHLSLRSRSPEWLRAWFMISIISHSFSGFINSVA